MSTRAAKRYVPAVGPRLKKLLVGIFILFALLLVNALYLSAITFSEWVSGETYQNFFYQYMFLAHLVLGFVILLPVIIYGAIHIHNARHRPNKRAIKAGYALFVTALVLLATGLTLTRGIPLLEIRDAATRNGAYWLHALSPLAVAWLFVMHRLAGRRISWRVGGWVGAAAIVLIGAALLVQLRDPRQWNTSGPQSGEQYFFPSLARTATGNFIAADVLMMDGYCEQCHADTHANWKHSMHRFSSFNNPAYLFSVRGTREVSLARDGNVQASRFCAGCHDLVPFFSGAFDDPDFDDVNHPTAAAGITCTGCHAITHVNSPRGNADYTIEEPLHYPFAFSDSATLQAVNRLLVKAKPAFHKKTFLKPLHKTAEFCGTCHKVHLPEELNAYKWLRGQNHYDSFLLSGVSGHGASSFYYPDQAKENCNGCHMETHVSTDFGAKVVDESGQLKIHNHQFPSANTAIPYLFDLPDSVNDAHRKMLEGALRVDLFALKTPAQIDGELIAPLDALVNGAAPQLQSGQSYLLEAVLRTLTLGHLFTEGTADSNEIWLEVKVWADGKLIGSSGEMNPDTGEVDEWAHFVNAYVLDKDGNRIDRRNAEDIFTPLYNHQIPPGAADVIHYRFTVPAGARRIELTAQLNYRKFDTRYYRLFTGKANARNDLPVTMIAADRVALGVDGGTVDGRTGPADADSSPVPLWQRWNDYGIGLLRKQGAGELRQAQQAFTAVAQLGHAAGELNLARVFLREGRLEEAVTALRAATTHTDPAPQWTIDYLSGLVNKQNGFLEQAAENFSQVLATNYNDARSRGFDFGKDYRVRNQLAATLFELAKLERGSARTAARNELLKRAELEFMSSLGIDPENASAHYGLAQIHALLGNAELESWHRQMHATFKVDDNARDLAIGNARRRSAAANHAADAIVIYDLHRHEDHPQKDASQGGAE